jgi:two-component system, cell cycle response regulator
MARSRPVMALLAAGMVLLAAFVVRAPGHWGGEPADAFFIKYVYDAIAAVVAVQCLWRAATVRDDRAIWALVAAGMLCSVVGNAIYDALYGATDTPPVPSWADAAWAAAYPLLYTALALRLRSISGGRSLLALDGIIATLAVAAVSAASVVDAILAGASSSFAETATSLAYPVGDIVLVGLVAQYAALNGWRLGATAKLMALAFATWAVTDTVYAYQTIHETYVAGGIVDAGWPLSWVLLGLAAWRRQEPVLKPAGPGWRTVLVAVASAVLALAMTVWAAFHGGMAATASLAGAALLAVIVRFALTFRGYLAVLRAAEGDAATDALTGLGNRRAMSEDLAVAVSGDQELLLLLFDLNGFKIYNDGFGHPAGDALLARLGDRLAASVAGSGRAYRMGGDEFCVLVPNTAESVAAACAALRESGEGFEITAAHGAVAVPAEARDAGSALRLADQRMYRDKRSSRAPAGEQAMHALLRVLEERNPDLGDHSAGVAQLAVEVARRLGLTEASVGHVRAGAELHDIGKSAIPDSILTKPAALDDEEWAFMRRHTLIGERIVAGAEALSPVAPLVRSSHERWDGGGYPDGLAGQEIPLGARIIAVCDAFDAMTAERAYSPAMPVDDALAELRRCSGTQFDPSVVAAFSAVARSPHAAAAA